MPKPLNNHPTMPELIGVRVTRDERAALVAAAAARGDTISGLVREALVAAGVRLQDTSGNRPRTGRPPRIRKEAPE